MVQTSVPPVYFTCVCNLIKTLKNVLMFNVARLLEYLIVLLHKFDSAPDSFVLYIFQYNIILHLAFLRNVLN